MIETDNKRFPFSLIVVLKKNQNIKKIINIIETEGNVEILKVAVYICGNII